MKYSIQVNYESESLEDDLAKVADIIMGSVERYFKIEKENKTQSEVNELNHNVRSLDTRIDGLEEAINDFREVVTKKNPEKQNNK